MSRAEEFTPASGAPAHGSSTPPPPQAGCSISRFWTKYIKVDDAWLREVRGHLITAATLTATMAYQSILSPPGSFWQETKQDATAPSAADQPHHAGQAIWDSKNTSFELYVGINTLQLGASLSTVMLAMAGFPPENKFLTWLLVFAVYVTVTCMAMAYLMAVAFVSRAQVPLGAIIGLILGWGFVCTFVLVLHTARLLVWLCKLVGCCRPTSRPPNQNSTGEGNLAGSNWRTSTST